ncbi:uncharacterized protein [Elaeis guineensis]|uniref:uncharacterized protein n=1 Tax=Elaeis guineensis var. tenera TaxID=51953 RepID=UPI003C6D4818
MEDLEKLMVRMMESRISDSEFSKITLETNPVKLDGPGTYLSWTRHVRLILDSHNLEGFISGTAKRPEGDGIAVRQWNSNNSRVVAWLFASMVPSIAHTVEALTNAYELWQAVAITYSYKGNNMHAHKIQRELRGLNQGSRSVTEYVGELKKLWNDFDFYCPFTPTHPGDVDVFRKWIEQQRLVDFLDGLNPEFEYRRSFILSTQKWPTLDETISLVLSEETRLTTISSSTNTVIRSVLVVQPNTLGSSSPNSAQETQPRPRGVKICDHCHKPGHIKAYCYELHGRPNRGCGRGGGRFGRDRGQYNQAHFSSMGDLSVEEMQLLKKFRSGVNISESSTSTEDFSNQPASSQDNFAQIGISDQIHALNCSNFSSWVVDSGASNHMTRSFRDFVSYIPCSGRDKVHLADGSFTPISGKGSIKCTSELSLSSVLHVPRFSINLLSISAITNDLDCAVTFFKTHCVFQEPKTGRKLVTGIMRNGFYYLEGGVSEGYSETSLTVSSSQKEDLLLQHRKLGHLSFTLLARIFPTVFETYKEKLVCDACELAKHTRSTYPNSGRRSKAMFELVLSDSSPLSESITHSPVSRSSSPVPTVSSSTTNGNSPVSPIHFTLDNDDLNVPIALRKSTRHAVKQTPEGTVERYKARLVAKGYTQTYGIDYDETFAPVAKINSIRTLISCAANFGWDLFQLDVKNAFLHGELQEEVYMDVPPGFSTAQTVGKVCQLRRSLYGLKQSPRAWFDRFRQAIILMGYKQSNADHTLFFRHNKGKIAVLIVYVDDIVVTGDDSEEIAHLKAQLA